MTFNSKNQLREITKNILESNIRGLKSVISTNVISQDIYAFDHETKKIEKQSKLFIVAEGDSIIEILQLQLLYKNEIDFQKISCDNPSLIQQMFGKIAASEKIVNETKNITKHHLDIRHLYLLGDEMTQTSKITSIQTDGLKQRNNTNDLLQIAESRPIANIMKAALSQKTSTIESVSGNILMGQTPIVGTNFNSLIINEEFYFNKQPSVASASQQIQNVKF